MTEIRIPRDIEVLLERANGLHSLLTAKEWERAAVIYAFTDIGGPRNSRQPVPPKVNIRQFAALGLAGLTTPKAVNRYRRAWVYAIEHGWAGHVEPGDTVVLPEQDFPAWDAMLPEYETPRIDSPMTRVGILTAFRTTRRNVERCISLVRATPSMGDEVRRQAIVDLWEIEEMISELKEDLSAPTESEAG